MPLDPFPAQTKPEAPPMRPQTCNPKPCPFALLLAAALLTTSSALALPPVVELSFSPDSVPLTVASELTITLRNPNPSAATGAAFTDTYPDGLHNAIGFSTSTDCSADPNAVTAQPGGSSVALVGGTIPADGSCTVKVQVGGIEVADFTNIIHVGDLTTTNVGSNAVQASATLHVTLLFKPSAVKIFSPDSVPAGVPSTLTFTISNLNASAMTGVAFTDTYPAGLQNAATPAASSTCGGTVTATPGGGSLGLSGASIPATQNCMVRVTVRALTENIYTNTLAAGDLTSSNGGSSVADATAILTVGHPIPALPSGLAAPLLFAALVGLRKLRGTRSISE
jgi:large repetitive protein